MSRQQGMDAAEAMIIVDRCRPPDGLGCAPHTLKAVLWCLRGLGAPGTEIRVPAEEIERRTCLAERTVRKAVATLRECGVLELVQAHAPGRAAAYRLHYARLVAWLDPEDRQRVTAAPETDTGTTCRRTPAADAGEHRQQMPVSNQHRHVVPPTPAPGAATPAADAGVPIRIAGASCIPAKDQQQQQAAAAAAGISREEWEDIGRRAGLTPDLAGQCAAALATEGWADRETGLVAMERLGERMGAGGVTNPVGLLLAILRRPGGPEPSEASIKRARTEDAKRRRSLEHLTPDQRAALTMRVETVLPDAGLVDRGRWLVNPLGQDAAGRQARALIWSRWDEIESSVLAAREAVPA